MLLTSDFVYVHMPKTGGTFVTEVVNRLYEEKTDVRPSLSWRLKTLLTGKRRTFVEPRKHGTCSEIPEADRHKMILATVRNPYDRYVSEYEFGWWRTHPDAWGGIADRAEGVYPNYPDLSFEEFVDMANTFFPLLHNAHFSGERGLGYQTEIFVRYFMKRPERVFPAIDQTYLDQRRYRKDLFGRLHFIRTQNLNRGLHTFLTEVGFSPEEVAFVLDMGKIHPPEGGRDDDRDWQSYYSPDLKRRIRTRERLLFELFPQFDV
jgi:hypothetical protein